MALGTGIGDVLPVHKSQQQGKKIYTNDTKSTTVFEEHLPNKTDELQHAPPTSIRRRSKSPGTAAALLPDDDLWDQNYGEANLALSSITSTRHQGLSSSTAYAENTDVMEVTYTQPRHITHDPLYTAHSLAPSINALAAPRTSSERTTTTPQLLLPQTNPFALAPSALPTWHAARTDLSNPTHFYTKMLEHYPSPEDPRPEPEERFAVRVLDSTLEIEQGLADMRGLLKECHRMDDEEALEGLRVRIEWALEGMR